ncbi:hypothetical protein F4680DRAFT_298868 [Xylaria scruposa]|nr:hypothetical protein F4680DRAFT_298868 [Xylaria scruposa]
MAYLNRAAQVALLVAAIVSALILLLVCLYLYSRDRWEESERQKQEDLEKRTPECEQQRWETVSADASTLSFLWDPPPPTRNVRRWRGFVVSEAPVVMEPCTARIEYA